MAESIRPGRLVAMHVPPADAAKVTADLRGAGISAEVAAVTGTAIVFGR